MVTLSAWSASSGEKPITPSLTSVLTAAQVSSDIGPSGSKTKWLKVLPVDLELSPSPPTSSSLLAEPTTDLGWVAILLDKSPPQVVAAAEAGD